MTLNQYRARRGIGYLKLAKRAGVSVNTVRNACDGGQPRIGAALRIHWATGGEVSLAALAGLTPRKAAKLEQELAPETAMTEMS